MSQSATFLAAASQVGVQFIIVLLLDTALNIFIVGIAASSTMVMASIEVRSVCIKDLLTVCCEGSVLCEGWDVLKDKPFIGEHCSTSSLCEQVSCICGPGHWCSCWHDPNVLQEVSEEGRQEAC